MKIFVDANVLMSRTARDWLVLCAKQSAGNLHRMQVRLLVSEDVLAEWMYRLRRRHTNAPEAAVGGLRRALLSVDPGVEVVRDYAMLDVEELRDPHDLHVVSAAAHARADFIAADDGDISAVADQLESEPMTSDDLLCLIAERDPALIREVTWTQMRYWGQKPDSKHLDEALVDAGAPRFAALVRSGLSEMARTGQY